MPYTQEATIRTHYKKLNKFVRLIDYLIIDSKRSMINLSTSSIVERNIFIKSILLISNLLRY